MRFLLAFPLALTLALPALAEGMRPLPRPATVERVAAFAGATDLAPRSTPRPAPGPAALTAAALTAVAPMAEAPATPLRIDLRPLRRAMQATLAALPPAPSGPAAAPDPIPDPARSLGATRSIAVTLSASNARAPLFLPVAMAARRPPARPEAAALPAMPRPAARPEALAAPERVEPAAFAAAPRLPAPPAVAAFASPRPAKRPKDLAARAAPRKASPPEQVILAAAAPRIDPGRALVVPKKGALCGDPRLQGAKLAPIGSQVGGCGIADPVRVSHVDGVRLSTPATLDCGTARALADWVTGALKPAAGKAGVAEIRVAAHYACRSRNNVKGARLSEHGKGRAIDIAGITLANGKALSVLGDYRRSEMLQRVRRAACGIFGTTLGPGSDRFHSDHFHFDTARHRNGPYCR